jgi:beta-fructofuranosidase
MQKKGANQADCAGIELRHKLAQDPHRPLYHFLLPSNWMNDPNGLIQWNGNYHLFYQTNPNGPFHGTIHWGHAVSEDLVYWEDLLIALAPTPGGPDEDGCYSGCAVDNDGVPTLIYTGVRGKSQLPCVATSRDDSLTSWEKYEGNPVIPSPPEGLDLVGFRDHSVWKEDGVWYQLIGSGIRGVGGAALLYKSEDLIHWEYLNPLHVVNKNSTEPVWSGTMWECPNFLSLGDKRVLIVSAYDNGILYHPVYFVGTYADHRFTPQAQKILDSGGHFYAPQTMIDDRGRRLVWGWLMEGRNAQEQIQAGWSGVMSLPRILSLRPDGFLAIEPVPELKALRDTHHRFVDLDLRPESSQLLGDIRADCLEIVAEIEPGEAAEFGVKVRRSPDGEEETLVVYDRVNGRLAIDSKRSSINPNVYKDARWDQVGFSAEETLKLHIFVDRSVVEVFANGRSCLTDRIYPSRADSLGMDLFARGGSAKFKSVDIWEMRPIWASGERRFGRGPRPETDR